MDLLITLFVFAVLLCSAAVGFVTQRRLHERHISTRTVESVRLLMGMLLTFSALVLGLLVSSAKARFDDYGKELGSYAADLIELDHRLRVYGPDAEEIRSTLRAYTAAAIADTWPDEPTPKGSYPRFDHSLAEQGVEQSGLGELLAAIDVRIEQLAPTDLFHQQIAGRLRNRVADAVQKRWSLILSAPSTVSWPFIIILTAWLAIIFLIFALTAPHDEVVYVVIVLAALSIVSSVYLILDYSGTQTGLLRLSSASLRIALTHMDAAN